MAINNYFITKTCLPFLNRQHGHSIILEKQRFSHKQEWARFAFIAKIIFKPKMEAGWLFLPPLGATKLSTTLLLLFHILPSLLTAHWLWCPVSMAILAVVWARRERVSSSVKVWMKLWMDEQEAPERQIWRVFSCPLLSGSFFNCTVKSVCWGKSDNFILDQYLLYQNALIKTQPGM